MRFALNSLAVGASDWLLAHSEQEWLYRYGHRIEEARLPTSRTERQAVAELVDRDGATLLAAILDLAAPPLLREIPAIEIMRQIWMQNYFYEDGQLRWRSNEDIPPPARYISSPYDREARYTDTNSKSRGQKTILFLAFKSGLIAATAHAEACQDLRREAEQPGIGFCLDREKQRARLRQA